MTKKTKSALIQSLLARNEGASMQAISDETGWQFHSIRAAISGLRKQGISVERQEKGAGAIYRIPSATSK